MHPVRALLDGTGGADRIVVGRRPLRGLLATAGGGSGAKHWRHAGEGVSSRQADAVLQGRPAADAVDAKRAVRERIAGLAGVAPEHVYLFGSGMAAMYAVYRAINRLHPGRKSVQVGFPYVDTLKIQQDMGSGVHFFARQPAGTRSTAGAVACGAGVGNLLRVPIESTPGLSGLDTVVRVGAAARHSAGRRRNAGRLRECRSAAGGGCPDHQPDQVLYRSR